MDTGQTRPRGSREVVPGPRARMGGTSPVSVVVVVTVLLLVAAAAAWFFGGSLLPTQTGPMPGDPSSQDQAIEEVARFRAPEAHQGVAVDETHFFAIGNTVIAKYDRRTGRKVGEWRAGDDDRFVHLNSCVVADAELVCVHSNYPSLPMRSSIERWSRRSLEHLGSREIGPDELPRTGGSLTWAIPRDGDWWLGFAHYDTRGGEPDRGTEWSRVVRMEGGWERGSAWIPAEVYRYPPGLVDRLRPFSASGAGWGPGESLWITGHDEPVIYVLRVPGQGSELDWVQTIPAPLHGQAWVFDPEDPNAVWGIERAAGEVVVGRLRTHGP